MAQGQTTDEARLKRERNREKREIAQAKADLAEVMSLPAGRRFMYHLLFDTCGLNDIYVAQDSGIYKHEGRRSVGGKLVLALQTEHAEAYILMITERMHALRYQSQIREEPKDEEMP